MGTWNTSFFGNDIALDFIEELFGQSNPSEYIIAILENILHTDELDADDCNEALICCVIIDSALNDTQYDGEYNKKKYELLANNVGQSSIMDSLRNVALDVLPLILSENSELYQLWQDSNDFEEWEQNIVELEDRIKII